MAGVCSWLTFYSDSCCEKGTVARAACSRLDLHPSVLWLVSQLDGNHPHQCSSGTPLSLARVDVGMEAAA